MSYKYYYYRGKKNESPAPRLAYVKLVCRHYPGKLVLECATFKQAHRVSNMLLGNRHHATSAGRQDWHVLYRLPVTPTFGSGGPGINKKCHPKRKEARQDRPSKRYPGDSSRRLETPKIFHFIAAPIVPTPCTLPPAHIPIVVLHPV